MLFFWQWVLCGNVSLSSHVHTCLPLLLLIHRARTRHQALTRRRADASAIFLDSQLPDPRVQVSLSSL